MFFLIVLPSTSQAKSDIESAGDIVQLAIPTIAYTTTFIYDDSEGRTQFYKSFGLNLALTY
ncbi:MAG: PAP2 family protein, partial [Agitococcus sp.]|nr:PAP2 family protein [Agitococcus sp.]